MPYGDFTLNGALESFALSLDAHSSLFQDVPETEVSEWLRTTLDRFVPLGEGVSTEKARSEFIIAPILGEVQNLAGNRFSLFSGIDFSVDAGQGLRGSCDFIYSLTGNIYELTAPVLMVVEAKKEDINAGMGQCVAEMVAARIFNQKHGRELPEVHGAVTSGSVWKFLRLQDQVVMIDRPLYYLDQIGKLLGIFLSILEGAARPRSQAA